MKLTFLTSTDWSSLMKSNLLVNINIRLGYNVMSFHWYSSL